MNLLCINCPGVLTGDCIYCDENEDPREGDYDEYEFGDVRPNEELDGDGPDDFGPVED